MSKKEQKLKDKMQNLDEMVKWFSSDEFELEEAIEKYKAALSVASEIEADLDEIKNTIEKIDEDFSK